MSFWKDERRGVFLPALYRLDVHPASDHRRRPLQAAERNIVLWVEQPVHLGPVRLELPGRIFKRFVRTSPTLILWTVERSLTWVAMLTGSSPGLPTRPKKFLSSIS